MKNLLYTFILTAITCSVANAQQRTEPDTSYANGYYKQRLEFFRKMPDHLHEIVFLGNSITEAGEWQELYPGKNVINRGISGDVTFGVIARMDEVLSSKPNKIFLLIGINDLKRGLSDALIIKNYERILKRVKKDSPATRLIIQSILPVNESMISAAYKRITNVRIKELNGQLEELAHQNKINFVDLHPVFEDAAAQMKAEYTTDGIHLKMSSYILWINYLKNKNLL